MFQSSPTLPSVPLDFSKSLKGRITHNPRVGGSNPPRAISLFFGLRKATKTASSQSTPIPAACFASFSFPETDIPTNCEFLLDYEIDEENWREKKTPYRYRWPDEVRDEVLARLLELNKKRAEEQNETVGGAGRPDEVWVNHQERKVLVIDIYTGGKHGVNTPTEWESEAHNAKGWNYLNEPVSKSLLNKAIPSIIRWPAVRGFSGRRTCSDSWPAFLKLSRWLQEWPREDFDGYFLRPGHQAPFDSPRSPQTWSREGLRRVSTTT